jgi:hypothetical protein
LAARFVRDEEAAGSNPATPTALSLVNTLPGDHVRLPRGDMPESGSAGVRFWERPRTRPRSHRAITGLAFSASLPPLRGVARLRGDGRKRPIRGHRPRGDGRLRRGDAADAAQPGCAVRAVIDLPAGIGASPRQSRSGGACFRRQADRAGLAAASSLVALREHAPQEPAQVRLVLYGW